MYFDFAQVILVHSINIFVSCIADIYDKVSEELEKDGLLDCECVGGGRIKHDPQAKKIHVYGYSMVRESCRKTQHLMNQTENWVLFLNVKSLSLQAGDANVKEVKKNIFFHH